MMAWVMPTGQAAAGEVEVSWANQAGQRLAWP